MRNRSVAVLVMAVLCMLLVGSAAYGFDQADLVKLNTTKSCSRCDLSGANLSGADLSGANLSWTNLSGADLSGANLTGANLYETVLSVTNLRGAKLGGAIWNDGVTCAKGSIGKCNH